MSSFFEILKQNQLSQVLSLKEGVMIHTRAFLCKEARTTPWRSSNPPWRTCTTGHQSSLQETTMG